MKSILIDASNLFEGGGLTHLRNFVQYFELLYDTEIKLKIIGNKRALLAISDFEKVEKISHRLLDKDIISRSYFRYFLLRKYAANTDLVLDLGGGYISYSMKYVTFSRNMLIFDNVQSSKYGFSIQRFRLMFLKLIHSISIKNSCGIIFVSQHAKSVISSQLNIENMFQSVINHGSSVNNFDIRNRRFFSISHYSNEVPFRILYVSKISAYKNHHILLSAVSEIRKKYPVELILVGGYEKNTFMSFLNDIKILDPYNDYIHYLGEQTIDDVRNQYGFADLFVFPSTCENMPNILIEAMSSALPIVCSNSSPMPEFLKDAGIYFIPSCKYDLERKILDVLNNVELRMMLSQRALEYSEQYRWEKCVSETITFIRNI